MFYDNSKILGYNSLIMYSLGNRSAGKSFCWKTWAVNRFLKGKGQFIYIRRYENELDKVSTFFDDISFQFPNTKFKVKGRIFYINDKIAGWAIPLSLSYKMKSVSFVNVTFMFFDEFLPENGRYLKNEFSKLQGFYQTVARGGGKSIREDCYLTLVANHVSLTNPYFQAMNIRVRGNEHYIRIPKANSVIEMFHNNAVEDEVKKSAVGGFLTLGEYGDYAQKGKFLLDDNTFIEKRPKGGKYILTIIRDGKEFGVLSFPDIIYIGKPIENFPIRYAFSNKDLKLNYKLIENWRNSEALTAMREAYAEGNVRFAYSEAKEAFIDIMNYA